MSRYEYTKRIGFSECDTNRKLTITDLIDAFQDCSTFQSEDYGVGYDVLAQKDLAWVINYWEIHIQGMPRLCDYVTVGSFPYMFKTCFGFRNFYLKDEKGDYLVKANSMWTLIDTVTQKPARAPEFISEAYSVEEKLDMPYNPRKVMIPGEDEAVRTEKPPIHIMSHHLDSNNHVNNGQYVKLAASELESDDIKALRIDYRMQAKLGDEIFPVVFSRDNERFVALLDENGKPYSVSQFIL